jgi:hypothetical protein
VAAAAVPCPCCGGPVGVDLRLAGQAVVCPHCRRPFQFGGAPVLPVANVAAAPAPEPPFLSARHLAIPDAAPGQGWEGLGEAEEPVLRHAGPGRRQGRGPLSLVSPGFLALSLALAACPWVEVRCEAGPAGGRALVYQSGYQAVYGGASADSMLEAEARGQEERARRAAGRADRPAKDSAHRIEPAPLVAAGLVCLALALAYGLLLSTTGTRVAFVFIFGCAGVACLVAQVAVGFPLEKAVTESMAASRARDADGGVTVEGAALLFSVRCTVWFWLSLAFAGCATAAALAEALAGARARGAYA